MLLNVAAYTAYKIPVLFTFLAPFTKTPLNSEKVGMGDNIRIGPFLKSKLQKLLKTTKMWHLEKWTLMLHNGNVFANTTKNPVSLPFIVTENWPGQNTTSKSAFFCQSFAFLEKLNFDFFCCKISVDILFVKKKSNFYTKGSRIYGSETGNVTHG